MSPITSPSKSAHSAHTDISAVDTLHTSVDTPRLEDFALAAIAAQLPPSLLSTNPSAELSFLSDRFRQVTQHHPTWTDALTHHLNAPHPGDRPLLQLTHTFPLTTLEILTISVTAALEENVHIGRALAHIQAPIGGSRPTLSLLAAALQPLAVKPSPISELVNGTAISSGLLTLSDTSTPLPEQTLSVPRHIHFALSGQDSSVPNTALGIDALPDIPLPPSTISQVQQYADSLAHQSNRILLLRAASANESRIVAARIAQQLGLRPLFLEGATPTGLAPWLRLRQLLPVFCPQLSPGERQTLPAMTSYTGPILAIAGHDGQLNHPTRDLLTWMLPVPTLPERQQLWEQALSQNNASETTLPEEIQSLSQYHRYSCDRIAQLNRLAQHHSALRGQPQPTLQDIRAAAWSGEGTGLDALAESLNSPIPDYALVLPSALKQDLHTLLHRCRNRDTLTDGLGASTTARYTPGVKALFVGPSGTGKTLAAGWIATQLGTPLYRVDLAAIISKYIGETEKNLAELLARAECTEVILLFDEADSCFAKRTDVQQANDRFANTQTNYLLQRIESYDGITLLTSNSRQRFDDAFTRRLDLIVEFSMPRSPERRALWLSHLGDHHSLTPEQINQLATLADLCGGHIRNAVLAAAVLAQTHHRPIHFNDIIQGVSAEYRKLSRQPPASLQPSH